jgi:hypothetical protein
VGDEETPTIEVSLYKNEIQTIYTQTERRHEFMDILKRAIPWL